MSNQQKCKVFCEKTHADLRGLLPATEVADLSVKFWNELKDLVCQICLPGRCQSKIARESHKLVSLAGGLGFEELAGLARSVNQAVATGDISQLGPALDDLNSGYERAREALECYKTKSLR